MKQQLNIDTWNRKAHYELFSQFEEPFHSVCVNIDCTAAYRFAKSNSLSFYLYYLYQSLAAVQQIEPFKYRIENGNVYIYETINASTTVGRADGTFGFGYFDFHPTLQAFMDEAQKQTELVQSSTGLVLSDRTDFVRFSALPWINFTSLSHARMYAARSSEPMISFGKMTEQNGLKLMPLSIHVHHGLVDGLHVGQYIDCFQQLMNQQA
ncbi:chloramphenicol acetyltransferase [Mucilaginibacter lacusdianchii]|uniref:chloramphenicol acetyltransferase n=1 Tax=Mucilaginibacter lacusdianchii TaxID=2684211 RepID=UPI00131B5BEA|nr:chloramphenicol acetyltransferase [Mucilaginibacter sp. JXJ CY 39]